MSAELVGPGPPDEFGERLAPRWTDEQLAAIERRRGDLLLDAGAGSGKTSVLVERFARTVIEDGVDVSAILVITFTEKAAAELRDRIRLRLRELGAPAAARATEGAFISTIHGFCARVLRAGALAAGLDPEFVVLDELRSGRLSAVAFERALTAVAAARRAAGGPDRRLRGRTVARGHRRDLRAAALGRRGFAPAADGRPTRRRRIDAPDAPPPARLSPSCRGSPTRARAFWRGSTRRRGRSRRRSWARPPSGPARSGV